MKRIRKSLALLLALLSLAGLAACSSAAGEARLIATTPAMPIATYPTQAVPAPHTVVVYNLTLELEVGNVQEAAAEAIRLNTTHGGRLVANQNWIENGRNVAFLEFAVPDDQSARLHTALLLLGRTAGETYATHSHDCLTCQPLTHISLYLRSGSRLLPVSLTSGWNPAHTFRSALRVFVTLFGFLADILIWLIVVVGPFGLVGWGITLLVRRLRKRRKQESEKPD
ncbi:MAG: hypothetical protein IT308_07385 [Anaerolineaceae bacterium]|nr:hypothetical protein [Anaerolineaceae bacterium]